MSALSTKQRWWCGRSAHPCPTTSCWRRPGGRCPTSGSTTGLTCRRPPDEALELHHIPNGHYASVFVDPYTGRVTGELGPGHLSRILLRFHWSFALGESGYLMALCVLGAVGTGAVVYRKQLLKVLLLRERVAWQGGWRTVTWLHRVLGVWAWLVIVVLFNTGAYLNYITVSGSFRLTQNTSY